MSTTRQHLGHLGENLAVQALQERGYRILERNVRVPGIGEIDILAQDGDTLVIVEVRTRRGAPPFAPHDSVGPRKQAKLRTLAQTIAYAREWEGPVRVDLVAVELRRNGTLRRLEIVRDIVEGA
ncbi:MAG: YraN family protein [Chloroflexi bacterium]|nr:YraN family protein [Chloroflexota bacterium]